MADFDIITTGNSADYSRPLGVWDDGTSLNVLGIGPIDAPGTTRAVAVTEQDALTGDCVAIYGLPAAPWVGSCPFNSASGFVGPDNSAPASPPTASRLSAAVFSGGGDGEQDAVFVAGNTGGDPQNGLVAYKFARSSGFLDRYTDISVPGSIVTNVITDTNQGLVIFSTNEIATAGKQVQAYNFNYALGLYNQVAEIGNSDFRMSAVRQMAYYNTGAGQYLIVPCDVSDGAPAHCIAIELTAGGFGAQYNITGDAFDNGVAAAVSDGAIAVVSNADLPNFPLRVFAFDPVGVWGAEYAPPVDAPNMYAVQSVAFSPAKDYIIVLARTANVGNFRLTHIWEWNDATGFGAKVPNTDDLLFTTGTTGMAVLAGFVPPTPPPPPISTWRNVPNRLVTVSNYNWPVSFMPNNKLIKRK